MTSLTSLLELLIFASSVWFFVIYGRPLVAKVRLQAEASALHDVIEDNILNGSFPRRDPAVNHLLLLSALAREKPESLGWSQLWAVSRVLEMRQTKGRQAIKVEQVWRESELSPQASSVLQKYERELDISLTNYILDSSSMWILLRSARFVLNHIFSGQEGPGWVKNSADWIVNSPLALAEASGPKANGLRHPLIEDLQIDGIADQERSSIRV